MKIAIDCIYTNDPAHCASNVKMKKIVTHLLEKHPEVHFYWLVPRSVLTEGGTWSEYRDFYPQSDRVRLIPYDYSTDRMREYLRVTKDYYDLFNFQGELWDVDIMITNRTSMVPHLLSLLSKPSRDAYEWSKRVFLIEDMPIMDFKKTVAMSNPRVQGLQTLTGYLSAHMTAISAFWEKDVILKEAKDHLSPSSLRYIRDHMIESSPVHVDKTELKTKASIQRMLDNERPFTMGFVGRMTHATRSEDIFEMMGKHWVYRAGKDRAIRCVISTQSIVKQNGGRVSRVGRVEVPEWMGVHRLPREGFWDLIRNEVDCIVFMSPEEDYSMSLMEPLLLGCPAILIRTRWSIPTVGPEYPFFVDNMEQAYGMVRAFYDNYPAMYKKFAEWSKTHFEPLMKSRNAVYVPLIVEDQIKLWHEGFDNHFKKTQAAENNEIVKLLAQYGSEHDGELVLFDAIEALEKEGKLRHLADKLSEEFAERVKITWGTDWNLFRLGLMRHGYKDASVAVGHMKKGN